MAFNVDFIGIGVEKAATYWVANCLREHPEICFASKKEIAFFNDFDQHFLEVPNPRYGWGISWYQRHFAHCKGGRLKGEYTPTYLYSEKAAQRIKKHFPKVRLIVCFRDPVKRAFSQYLHDSSTGLIRNLSFEEALKKHESYVEKGYYYKYLSNYLKYFSKGQILALFTQDIEEDPKGQVKKLYKFLGLKNTNFTPESLNSRPNRASRAKVSILNYFLLQTEYFLMRNRLDFLLKFLENTGFRKMIFLFSYNSNRKPLAAYPEINPETERKLRKLFLKDIKRLEKLLRRKLAPWKTNG